MTGKEWQDIVNDQRVSCGLPPMPQPVYRGPLPKKLPSDREPFKSDIQGASKFCLDLINRMKKGKWKNDDYTDAVYWSARCAGHWAFEWSRASLKGTQ